MNKNILFILFWSIKIFIDKKKIIISGKFYYDYWGT